MLCLCCTQSESAICLHIPSLFWCIFCLYHIIFLFSISINLFLASFILHIISCLSFKYIPLFIISFYFPWLYDFSIFLSWMLSSFTFNLLVNIILGLLTSFQSLLDIYTTNFLVSLLLPFNSKYFLYLYFVPQTCIT